MSSYAECRERRRQYDHRHSYEKRWNVMLDRNYSHYTDDVAEVIHLIAAGRVRWIAEGHAEYEDVLGSATQIGGTIITRHNVRSFSAGEFMVEFAADLVAA